MYVPHLSLTHNCFASHECPYPHWRCLSIIQAWPYYQGVSIDLIGLLLLPTLHTILSTSLLFYLVLYYTLVDLFIYWMCNCVFSEEGWYEICLDFWVDYLLPQELFCKKKCIPITNCNQSTNLNKLWKGISHKDGQINVLCNSQECCHTLV